jgi:uncharacterized delta-60 repeat protein
MGKSTVYQGAFVKTLKNNLKLKDAARILTGTDDPRSVATEAEKGSLYLRQNTNGGQVFYKLDDGTTTNWRLLSDGSGQFKVDLYDPITTALPTGTSAVIDGVTVANGDLVFFNNLGSNNERVYEVSGVGVSLVWTALPIFSGEMNPEAGDRINVIRGDTFSGQTVYYDGSEYKINDVVRYFDGDKGVNYYEQTSLKTKAITNNTSEDIFAVTPAGSENMEMSFSIKRGSTKEVNIAHIAYTPGQDAEIAYSGVGPGVTGVDILANIEVRDEDSFYSTWGTAFSNSVLTIVEQTDGKIVVGGSFNQFNGVTKNRLMRFNTDGTEDTAFYTNLGTGFNSIINEIFLQPDGKIIVVGGFATFNGNTRNGIVRLNSDGTEDATFAANTGTGFGTAINANFVYLQNNDQILIGGSFTTFNGNTRNSLVRLNSDGTEDAAFYTNLGAGFNNAVHAVYEQANGQILVAGQYTLFDSNPHTGLVRLNSDGTLDATFTTNLGSGFASVVFLTSVIEQPDGKILVGGNFTSFDSNTRNRLVRLNSDGTEDTAFYTNLGAGFNASVVEITYDSSADLIYASGNFTSFDGNTRNYMLRLNSDGTEDAAFYTNLGTGFSGLQISTITLGSGKIFVGGNFTSFDGNTRKYFVKLDELLVVSYDADNSGENGIMKYSVKRWSDSPGGPSGIPNYSQSNLSSVNAAGSPTEIQFHGAGGTLDADADLTWTPGILGLGDKETHILQQYTILNNQTGAVLFQYPVSYIFAQIAYSIERDGETRVGTLHFACNGTAVQLRDDGDETATTGVTISADVSGGNVRLLYDSTNTTPGIFKGALIRWQ